MTSRMYYRRASAVTMAMIVTACVLVLFQAGTAAAQLHHKSKDLKQQVEELEQQWRTAQLAGDVAAMDKLLSEDYIGISMNGQVNTKAQQLERISTRRVSITRLDLSEMKVKLIGSIAIVTSRAQVEGTSDNVSVKGNYRYTRVYQRLPTGVWKITSFEATRLPQPPAPNATPTVTPSSPSPSNELVGTRTN
jgi:ketosteroid isomerase-like protein